MDRQTRYNSSVAVALSNMLFGHFDRKALKKLGSNVDTSLAHKIHISQQNNKKALIVSSMKREQTFLTLALIQQGRVFI